MVPLHTRDESDSSSATPDPPSPGSYWFPLLVVVLVCVGYLVWRRRRAQHDSFGLKNFSNGPAAVRLSMDDDGPAATSFIMNNGSNESLPSHALSDLPTLQEPSTISDGANLVIHAAYQDRTPSPAPSYISNQGINGMPSTGLSRTGSSSGGLSKSAVGQGPKSGKVASGRRSARRQGPVEGTDEESDSEQETMRDDNVFGIGDEEEDEDPLRSSGKE